MVTQTITLSMIPGGVTPRIYASQNDHGLRVFVFNLVDENGGYAIPSGTTALLNVLKPDRTVVSETCTWSGSTVTADCTEQMTAVAGNVHCEVRLVAANGDAVGSANFILGVESNPLASGVVSESDFDSISDMVDRAVAAASVPPTYVTDWLDENITQETGYVIDKSLTIENAAADAKAAGDLIRAAFVVGEASGSIASFTDGADGVPLKDLVVNVEPSQNLHGQANPYPAGGGKNLLEVLSNTQTISGVTFTVNRDSGGNVVSVTANGTATANIYYQFVPFENSAETLARMVGKSLIASGISGGGTGQYLFRSQYKKNGTNYDVFSIGSESATLSYPSDAEQISIQLLVYSGVTINTTVYPMIRLASDADATFAPYSNICPISGWTRANIIRRGKNLLGNNATPQTLSGVTYTNNSDHSITTNGTATASNGLNIHINLSLAPGNYILSGCPSGGASGRYGLTIVINNTAYFDFGSGLSFTINQGDVINRVRIVIYNGISMSNAVWYPMIRPASDTDATYEPYNGNTYNVSFGGAGTVYGGTLDVTTGMLTVDRVMVDLGTLTWAKHTTYTQCFYTQVAALGVKPPAQNGQWGICSNYPVVYNQTITLSTIENTNYSVFVSPRAWSSANPFVVINDPTYSTAEAFNTAMSGVQLCFELQNPVSYQLTPTEVKTLLGNNNIWSDTGSVASCEYRADTKLYIEKLTASDNDMTANANITSGSYFMTGNTLYKATSNIANGAAIIPGTNCTRKSLAEALNEINA